MGCGNDAAGCAAPFALYRAVVRAAHGADGYAGHGADIRAEGLQKNGSDAEMFAEMSYRTVQMQNDL